MRVLNYEIRTLVRCLPQKTTSLRLITSIKPVKREVAPSSVWFLKPDPYQYLSTAHLLLPYPNKSQLITSWG